MQPPTAVSSPAFAHEGAIVAVTHTEQVDSTQDGVAVEIAPAPDSGPRSESDTAPVAPPRQPAGLEPMESPNSDWPATLTLDVLETAALSSNPAVAQANAALASLQGKWEQAGLPPNPRIGYMGNEMSDRDAGFQGGFVSQQFVLGGKLESRRSVVAMEIEKAMQRLAEIEQRVLTDVRIAYYDVLISQRRAELSRELLTNSRQAVEVSKQLLAAGEIPRVGLLQTEVDMHNARILAKRADNELTEAWRRLASILGRPVPPRTLSDVLDESRLEMEWGERLERIRMQSPEMAAAVAELDRARRTLERAEVEAIPDVTVQFIAQHDNTQGNETVGVQVGLPLPIWNWNQGGIHQAFHEVSAAKHNIERVELDLQRRLAAAFRDYGNAKFQTDNYRDEVLPKARETYDLVRSNFEQGQVGYLDMLAAQRTFFQSNLTYIESLRDMWRAALLVDGLLLQGAGSKPPLVD